MARFGFTGSTSTEIRVPSLNAGVLDERRKKKLTLYGMPYQHIFSILGKLGTEDNKAILKAGVDLYAQFGFTTAQEGRAMADAVITEAAVSRERGLKMDVVAYPDIQGAATSITPPLLSRTYTNHFRIGGAKLSLDGSPQGKTAWLTRPYFVPPPGQRADYVGYPAMTDEQAIGYVDEAFKNGWQTLAHCSGDAAADQLIKAIRLATAKYGKADRRPVMIHAHTVREDQPDLRLRPPRSSGG